MRTFRWIATVAVCVPALASPASAGDKGTPVEAQALLDKAAKAMGEGEAKALAAFNDPKGGFVDRDLYVFCFDAGGKITAHRDAKMVGVDATTLKDPDGKEIGKAMMETAKKGGGTVEYRWPNPVSQKVEAKVSFIKKAGSQSCGVGAYK